MDLTTQAHLAAGACALALGLAALARDPGRSRSRLFAALALSLATWNLAAAARHEHWPGREAWRALTYVGGSASGPVALHLSLVLAGRQLVRRRVVAAAYVLGVAGLVAAVLLRDHSGWTRVVAVGLPLLLSLGAAALALRAHVRTRAGASDRRALRILLALGAVAAVAGVSDLVPRGDTGVPPLGPLALLPFLFALATIGLQRRYLEIDHVVARILAVGLAAIAAGAFLQAFVGILGPSGLTFFLGSLVVVAAAGPLAAAILAGTRVLLDPGAGEAARELGRASEELARAQDADAAWRAIEGLGPRLPGDARLSLRLGAAVRPDGALAALLVAEHAPATRRLLAIDAREAPDPVRRRLATDALAEMEALDLEIAAPLLRDGALAGVAGLGGGRPERYVGGATAAALLALGHQALATLDRIEAVEVARRKEALAVVGEMAASLAHDVRNPLGAIRGAAQVLAEARDPAQEKEMLAVIDSESERLGRVLGDFLEWARMRPARRDRVDAVRLARRVATLVELASPGAAVELDAGGRFEVLGDEELLARALGNLARNAREAAGPGGRVSLRVRASGPGLVEIAVIDDGPGLPSSVRARLFEPFVTTKPGGTGLGLPLALRAARAHGGSLGVRDESPRGTAFLLVLPAAPEHDDPA